MQKYFSMFFCSVLLAGLLFVPKDTAQSTVFITAPDGFSIVCAPGFVRTSPHVCFVTVQSSQGLILDSTCRILDGNAIWGIPTNATSVLIKMVFDIRSSNAIAHRGINVIWNDTAGCGGNQNAFAFGGREFAAVAAATTIYNVNLFALVQNTPTGMHYAGVLTGGGGSGVGIVALGYYD